MFTGTTTASLALVPSVESVTSLDIEPYLKEVTEPFFREAGILEKIDVRIGDAKEEMRVLASEGKQFDLVRHLGGFAISISNQIESFRYSSTQISRRISRTSTLLYPKKEKRLPYWLPEV